MEANKAILRHWVDELNRGSRAVLDELIVPEYLQHTIHPGTPQGLAGAKVAFERFWAAIPDMHIATEDMIAEGDRVVTRSIVRGTHRGEFMGVPATRRRIVFGSIDIFRLREGKFVEHWDEVDRLGLLEQLLGRRLP